MLRPDLVSGHTHDVSGARAWPISTAAGAPLTLPLFPPPQKNRSPPSDSSPDTPTPGGISSRSRTSPVCGSIRRTSLAVAFPGAVPELAVDPGDPGDEAVGLDGAKDRPGLGIDLMDLPVAILPHPERAFGPGEPRVAAAAGRRDGGEHAAGLRIDLLDAILGDLKQMPAVERRSRMRGDIDRAHASVPLAGSRAFSLSPEANQTCWPSKVTPCHLVDTRKGAILTEDFGR